MPRNGFASLALRLRRIRESNLGQFVPVLMSLLVIWAFFGLTEPAFLTPRNFHFLLMQSAVVATLAAGVTVVLLIGDIDLSIAAVAGVGAAILAVLITNLGAPAWVAVTAALAAGIALGFVQGWIIAFIGIPSFVVTLAGLLGFQGLMLKILGIHGALNMRDPAIRGLTTTGLPEWLGWLLAAAIIFAATLALVTINGRRRRRGLERMEAGPLLARIAIFAALALAAVATLNAYRGVPLLVLILGTVIALLWWITVATPFGRHLFATGGNPESARRVGIPVRRCRVAGRPAPRARRKDRHSRSLAAPAGSGSRPGYGRRSTGAPPPPGGRSATGTPGRGADSRAARCRRYGSRGMRNAP